MIDDLQSRKRKEKKSKKSKKKSDDKSAKCAEGMSLQDSQTEESAPIAMSDLINIAKKRCRKEGKDETFAKGTETKKKKSRKSGKESLPNPSEPNFTPTTQTTTSNTTSESAETDPFPYLEEDCCETQAVA